MLYDRSYMKTPKEVFARSFTDSLIFSLIGFFLVHAIASLISDAKFINNFFAFSLDNFISGFIWTPFTYALLHDGPFHLIVNLLGLHFIGRPVETILGKSKYKLFCLSSVLLGLLVWTPFNAHDQYIVGSSAIVLSALCFFCLNRPNEPITLLLFFILPAKIKPKWVLLGTLLLEIYGFFTVELYGFGAIAHSAHLGGMFCGLLFFLFHTGRFYFPFRIRFTKQAQPNRTHLQKSYNSKYRVNFGSTDSIKKETDRILDKINSMGFGSLTTDEKETLEKAKKLLDK